MECKRCHAAISPFIAGETTRTIKTVCEAMGMSPDAVDALLKQQSPLCRTCMAEWGAGEEDFPR